MTSHHVCIDARMIRASGIGTYLRGLLQELARRPPTDLTMTLLGRPSELPTGPWKVIAADAPIYSLREQWEVPTAFERSGAALLHSPHYNVPVLLNQRAVVTVHDAIHFLFPDQLPSAAARLYMRLYFRVILPRVRWFLTVSDHSKSDLADRVGLRADRITVARPAVDGAFSPHGSNHDMSVLTRYGCAAGYWLYVGNLKDTKNTPALLEAYRLLQSLDRDTPPLVLVGKNFISGMDQRLKAAPGVRWLGEIEPNDLPVLYRHASLFVFPSAYEGFGLPPLEAMACGTPVLCSNRASLPEVVGSAAIQIDPSTSQAIAEGLRRLSTDASLRARLSQEGVRRAAQFSWASMAETVLSVYRRALKELSHA